MSEDPFAHIRNKRMSEDPFAHIRNKRMSELTEEDVDLVMELWLRENALSFGPYYAQGEGSLFPSVFRVIDRLRAPINMVLHCPKCGVQHIDAPEFENTEFEAGAWTNPPHRSHLCHSCGHIWRPADVPTNGVAAVATKGKADSPIPEAPGP